MGAWGTGLKDSDEFMDCYDEFYSAFKDGKDASELANEIWEEHITAFPDETALDSDTDILHTVRFALALCLWECGVREHFIISETEHIIKNGFNLKFWGEENGGDKKLADSRKKVLDKFLNKLQTTPSKIKTPSKTRKPRTPSFKKGDIFAYHNDTNGYRAAIILENVEKEYLIAVSDTVYSDIPDMEAFLKSNTSLVFWITEKMVLPKRERIPVGSVDIARDFNGYAGLFFDGSVYRNSSCGYKDFFYASDSAKNSMRRNNIRTYQIKQILTNDLLPVTKV